MNEQRRTTRPIEVSVVALLYYLYGAINIAMTIRDAATSGMTWSTLFLIAGRLIPWMIGWGLWNLRPWARYYALIGQAALLIIELAVIISNRLPINEIRAVYLAFLVATLIGLNTHKAKRAFGTGKLSKKALVETVEHETH